MSAEQAREAFEADVAANPLYSDGTPRKMWDQLTLGERNAWDPEASAPWRDHQENYGGGSRQRKSRSSDVGGWVSFLCLDEDFWDD